MTEESANNGSLRNVAPKDGSAKKKRRGSGKKKRSVVMPIIVLCLIVVAAAGVYLSPMVLKHAAKDAVIKIPRGATIEMVHDSVSKYLGDDYARYVMMAAKVFKLDAEKRHGAYIIKKGATPLSAGRLLARGGKTGVTLTINGHRTKEDLALRIASALDVNRDEMLAALSTDSLLSKYSVDPETVMTLFLNNSYELYWDATPEDVIARMHEEYGKFWNEERTKKADALGITPTEVCIIASIVDEETNMADEKGRVGRLYLNRYKTGMRLQADPTVRYALGDFTIKRVTGVDLKTESPYNTYIHKGLPPGPIRTPDGRTIDALLNSEESDDLFMCADASFNGRHHFSPDYQTHLQYSKKYHEALNKRNIYR